MDKRKLFWIGIALFVAYSFFGKQSHNSPQINPSSALAQPISTLRVENYSANSFGSYSCTDDCSGHQAGYDNAEENGITDSDECSGNSESFVEGCREYVDEHEIESESEQ